MENSSAEISNKRVLIVDDTESIHSDFKKILSNVGRDEHQSLSELESELFGEGTRTPSNTAFINYQIEDAFQGEEAIQMVINAEEQNQPYALIFMDVRMPPGMSGIDAVEKIWAINPTIEIVICTAYSDYSWEEIIHRLGSSDHLLFLKKPFYSAEVKQLALSLVFKKNLGTQVEKLIQSLEGEVKERTLQLQQATEELRRSNLELQKKNNKLKDLTERDGLTGLLNHSAIHQRLEEVIQENQRHQIPFCIIMFDIDNFKCINDLYGHQVGDEVLLKLANVLHGDLFTEARSNLDDGQQKRSFRKYDIAGRYGGDEFVIILPFCTGKNVETIVLRLMEKIKAIRINYNPDLKITVSLGILAVGEEPVSCGGTDLLHKADSALYQSKFKGKDCYSTIHLNTSN